MPGEPLIGASASFSADLATAFASVPEPATAFPLLALGCTLAYGRRRRRR